MIDGRKLRAFREKRGLTQLQVASESGITKQTVSQMERTPNVGLEAAERYVNAVERIVGDRQHVAMRTVRIRLAVDVASVGPVSADDMDEYRGLVS